MIAKCKVTFEYEVRPPDTWSGKISATGPHTIVGRATKKAATEIKPRNWTSMVVVITERSGNVSESTEADSTAAPES